MGNEILKQINWVIGEIEHQNDVISKITVTNDPVFISVIKQSEVKKKKLYKKLLNLLLQSNVHFEDLNQEIVDYLKKDENSTIIESDFAERLRKARRMLA